MSFRVSHNYLVPALVVTVMAAPASAQTVKEGIEAWQQADYSRAVAVWRPLAEKGNADAQFDLGEAYRLGRGVTLNIGAATIWFERAAKQGHIDAQRILGLLLFQNGDRTSGLKWLKMAADKDDAGALLIYGTVLANGDGLKRDPILGYAYVSRAAHKGFAPARETLADLDRVLSSDQRQRAMAMPIGEIRRASERAKMTELPIRRGTTRIAKPPLEPLPSAHKPTVAELNGSWRIQLGAFSQRAAAETLFRKLLGNSALSGRHPYFISVGPITRLQAGPFESKEAAAATCKSLATACFPVPPK